MDTLWNDLRYAVRQLRRAPGFFLVAAFTLALAIGGSTAIFSVVHAVLLRPFPFPEPERLVRLYELASDGEYGTLSASNFADWQRDTRSFEGLAAINRTSYTLTGEGDAEEITSALVTPGFFSILRLSPFRGRLISEADGRPDAGKVVVLSHGIWQRRFGSDPAVLGRTIRLDDEPYEVIGILPPGAEYPATAELWTTLTFTPQQLATQRGAHYLEGIGRLAGGVTLPQADADLRAIAARLAREFPRSNDGLSATVMELRESHVGDVRRPLYILLGAVGLVLLIACANVAGLLLTRAVPREREFAIRTAVGASRNRLVRQMLTESMVLALLGAGGGLLLATWGTELLVALRPRDIPRLDQARLDGVVLAVATSIALLTAVLFGLLPALQTSGRLDLAGGLREGAVASHVRGGRMRSALVVGELALSLMLLVAAGLLMRSFLRLQEVDPGFDPERVITYNISLPSSRYPDPMLRVAFVDRLREATEAIPGVQRSGVVVGLPMSGFSFFISLNALDGRALDQTPATPTVSVRIATPGYVETIGMRLLHGRDIDEGDRIGAPPVVLVNDAAAKLLWPGTPSALGRSLALGTRFIPGGPRAGGEVVGVVADHRDADLASDAQPTVFLPYAQNPASFLGVAVRTRGSEEQLVPALRARLAELDPDMAMFQVRTMGQRISDSVARPRYYMVLLGLFAAVALTLGVVGMYGVMASAVSQRTREIGIRIALGARQERVLRDVLGRGLLLASIGLGLGLLGVVAGMGLLEGLLYGVEPLDPVTIAGVAVVLGAAMLLASWLPARRASRVDPLVALRTE